MQMNLSIYFKGDEKIMLHKDLPNYFALMLLNKIVIP